VEIQIALLLALFLLLILAWATLLLRDLVLDFDRYLKLFDKQLEVDGTDGPVDGPYTGEELEAGLYHPTWDDIQEKYKRLNELAHKEQFDYTEDWGRESIFDLPMELEPGRYGHDGE
jgi:hypothetical protein